MSDLQLQDANVINYRFSDYNWRCGQYETDSSVQHWDFTEYGTDWEADDGDFLYYMGHAGSSSASNGVTIYSPLMLQGWNYYSNTHSRSYVNPDRIGTYSNSKWNTDLEWAMFAACSTLRNTGSAARWGKTLYNGMHQLLGYKNTSHGHPDDTIIAHSFATRAMGTSIYRQVFTSFRYAHTSPIYPVPEYSSTTSSGFSHSDNPTIWAAVMHEANYNDLLHGNDTGATADVNGSVSDVRYYDYQNYTKSGGIILFGESSINLELSETKKYTTKKGNTVTISGENPEYNEFLSIKKVKSLNPSLEKVSKKYKGTKKVSTAEYLSSNNEVLSSVGSVISYTRDPELKESSYDIEASYNTALDTLKNTY